jgi:hypothetical protein
VKRPTRKPGTTGGGTRQLARRGIVFLLTLAAVSGVVWGIKSLGDSARRGIVERDRYAALFSDIDCDAPPGYERINFLSEVSYHSKFPRRFQSIDPDLEPKLSAAFAAHPWVAAVEDISVEPENRIRVKLKFRVPALAVWIAGTTDQIRVADTRGVLLPLQTEGANLPRLVTPVLSPTTASGKPWPDETVKRAVELVEAHHPTTLEKTGQEWRLTMSDGKVLVVEK